MRFECSLVGCRGAGAGGGGWGAAAREAPGTGGGAGLLSVSCAAAGSCSAGGYYASGTFGRGGSVTRTAAFAVSQVNGAWGAAREVPGIAALAKGGFGSAAITSVSCAAAWNCSAGGYYQVPSGRYRAFVVSQVRGTWGTAQDVGGAGRCGSGRQYTDKGPG